MNYIYSKSLKQTRILESSLKLCMQQQNPGSASPMLSLYNRMLAHEIEKLKLQISLERERGERVFRVSARRIRETPTDSEFEETDVARFNITSASKFVSKFQD